MKKNKDVEYRLCGDIAPLSCIIPTGAKGNLLVFDEEENANRAIRHCRNEKSIFIDEQSDHAMVDAIVIERGYITIKSHEVSTLKFLNAHPHNKANGGHLFEEVNEEKEAAESLERQDLILDLMNLVRAKQKEEAGIYELQAVVAVLKNSVAQASEMSSSELRREIYIAIESNPERFTNNKGEPELFDEQTKRKHLALMAISKQLIIPSTDGRSLLWGDTKDLIINVPRGRKASEYLSEYLETDEGMLILDAISEKI